MLGFTDTVAKGQDDIAAPGRREQHFVDRLVRSIHAKGTPVCISLHPVYKNLPAALRRDGDPVAAIEAFCEKVFKTIAPIVPAVKIHSACFERYFAHGIAALNRLTGRARRRGLITILDGSRSGYGTSAIHYAAGNLADRHKVHGPDALTIASYAGRDGIEPYADVAVQQGKGLFAEIQTANASGVAVQSLILEDGRSVAEAIGQIVSQTGSDEKYIGESGYSLIGAVIGASGSGDEPQLRRIMPQQFFLIPDFDAKSGDKDSLRACFRDDGTGALVCSNDDVLQCFDPEEDVDFTGEIEQTLTKYKRQINKMLGLK